MKAAKNSYGFQDMVDLVPEGACGEANIRHIDVTEHDAFMSRLTHYPITIVDAGRFVRLIVDKQIMMSDTRMERLTNRSVAFDSTGDVLIAGLGIGLIVHPMIANKNVKSIIVIEKSKDVIDLVAPTIKSDKVKIIHADIHSWRPEKGVKFDVVYFDIWPKISTENLPEIAKLHQAFKRYKRSKDSWMGSWMHDFLKLEKRRYG